MFKNSFCTLHLFVIFYSFCQAKFKIKAKTLVFCMEQKAINHLRYEKIAQKMTSYQNFKQAPA